MKTFRDLPSVAFDDCSYLVSMPGIYIAATIDQVLYVGQSVDLKKRWKDHHKYNAIAQYEGVRLYYLVSPVDLLNTLEVSLIQDLRPILNARNLPKPISEFSEPLSLRLAYQLDIDLHKSRHELDGLRSYIRSAHGRWHRIFERSISALSLSAEVDRLSQQQLLAALNDEIRFEWIEFCHSSREAHEAFSKELEGLLELSGE